MWPAGEAVTGEAMGMQVNVGVKELFRDTQSPNNLSTDTIGWLFIHCLYGRPGQSNMIDTVNQKVILQDKSLRTKVA